MSLFQSDPSLLGLPYEILVRDKIPKDLVNMAKEEMIPILKKLTHLKIVFAEEEKLFNEEYRDRKSPMESGSETWKDFERSVIQNTVID